MKYSEFLRWEYLYDCGLPAGVDYATHWDWDPWSQFRWIPIQTTIFPEYR